TDGVTECRKGERFIERAEVLNVIKQYIHLSAQQMVDNVYKHFERMQGFRLRDDFTLMITRYKVYTLRKSGPRLGYMFVVDKGGSPGIGHLVRGVIINRRSS